MNISFINGKEDDDISCAGFDIHYDNESLPSRYPMGNVTLSASEAMVELCRLTWLPNTAWEKLYRAELFDGIFFKKGRVHEDVEILHHLFSKARKKEVKNEEINYNYCTNIQCGTIS